MKHLILSLSRVDVAINTNDNNSVNTVEVVAGQKGVVENFLLIDKSLSSLRWKKKEE